MHHLLYLQRSSPASSTNCKAERTSTSCPNPSRFPAFTVFGRKKALPTVSITNTNVSRDITSCPPSDVPDCQSSHSFIPFPSSAPVQCPTPRIDASEPEPYVLASSVDKEDAPATSLDAPVGWGTLCIRSSSSVLASSYYHRDSLSSPPDSQNALKIPRRGLKCVHPRCPRATSTSERLEPRGPGGVGRRQSMSTGSAAPPCPSMHGKRSARRSRRGATEVQFLAIVHRSIACVARQTQRGARDACTAQDVVLAERLWKTLVEHGCRPVPFDDSEVVGPPTPPPSPPPSPTTSSPVPLPSCMDDNPLPTPPQTPTVLSPVSALSLRSEPIPRTATLPDVLTMSQLVASLTLRYRDRSASRPRLSLSKDGDVGSLRQRSSLSRVLFVAPHAVPSSGMT